MDTKLENLFQTVLRDLASEGRNQKVINELKAIAQIDSNQQISIKECSQGVLFKALQQMYTEGKKSIQAFKTPDSAPAGYTEYPKISVRTKSPKNTVAADKFAIHLAPLLRKMREESDTTLEALAVRLTKLGVPTPKGGKWYAKSVRKLESRIQKLERQFYLSILMVLLSFAGSAAQDPVLPATNLGMVNSFDGMVGKPGFVYQGYAQVFQTRKVVAGQGQVVSPGLKVNSLLQMNQFIYLTPLKLLGGNLAFTVLVPIVQIAASTGTGPAPSVNPGVLGDLVQGTAIQWSGKKLFDKPFSHRAEVDFNLPVGSFDKQYNINPSAHAFGISLYHAFTLMLTRKVSISSRNQINYNARLIGQKQKAGAFYNGNYTIDLAIRPSLRILAAAYLLTQINHDSFEGNNRYYQTQMGIANTKERVLGYGAGLAYFTQGGAFLEIKTFFETAAVNRVVGYRPTLRIAVPIY